jgi:hypothetical protein
MRGNGGKDGRVALERGRRSETRMTGRRRLVYHHAIHGQRVALGSVGNEPGLRAGDEWLEPAYEWLAGIVGFWPLFLAVGAGKSALRETGYANQWTQLGRGTNEVLFSWREAPADGMVFSDVMWWTAVINALEPPDVWEIDSVLRRRLFRPDRRQEDWVRAASRGVHVQAVAPAVDLSTANAIWCRNQRTRRDLVRMGFAPAVVQVRRVAVDG